MNHEIHENHEKLRFADEVFRIQGAVFEVYRAMRSGFLESVYRLGLEFGARRNPFRPHPSLKLAYKGRALTQAYTPDFICFGEIIIELKAVSAIVPEHRAQIINYLRASGLKLGLLVNFVAYPRAQIERFAL